jgi:hypothetical protein
LSPSNSFLPGDHPFVNMEKRVVEWAKKELGKDVSERDVRE